MNSVEAFEQDIMYQVTDLEKFQRPLNIRKLNHNQQKRCVLTGAGDSFAAALVAQVASENKIQCVDPMDICANPSMLKGKRLFTISVSGNTKANIAAANIANKIGTKTVAVTANPNSKLAKVCDEVIEIKFKSSGLLTVGSIGFTTFMLSCLSLVKDVKLGNVEKLFEYASREAEEIETAEHMYVVGGSFTYPLAIYGSAKMYEMFGTKTQYAMVEQFCHMELFSVKKSDTILLLSAGIDKTRELYAKLKEEDYKVHISEPHGRNLEEKLLYHAMLLQLIVLRNAKKQKLTECYFIRNNRLRNISSSLIY